MGAGDEPVAQREKAAREEAVTRGFSAGLLFFLGCLAGVGRLRSAEKINPRVLSTNEMRALFPAALAPLRAKIEFEFEAPRTKLLVYKVQKTINGTFSFT